MAANDLHQEIKAIIEKYNMLPHPEGGFYVETFRSDISVKQNRIGADGNEEVVERPASTAILFLITSNIVSRLHRIRSDEVWHFYGGGPMTVVELEGTSSKLTTLGPADNIQYVVKRDTWFGSYSNEGSIYSLVGCTVAPGFVFEDFELGSRAKLLEEFPDAKEIVTRLTEGLP